MRVAAWRRDARVTWLWLGMPSSFHPESHQGESRARRFYRTSWGLAFVLLGCDCEFNMAKPNNAPPVIGHRVLFSAILSGVFGLWQTLAASKGLLLAGGGGVPALHLALRLRHTGPFGGRPPSGVP